MKKGAKNSGKNINLSNRWLYTMIFFGILVFTAIGITAYGGKAGSPSIVGHTINETAPPSPCSSGQYLQWTAGGWACSVPSGLPTCSANQILFYNSTASSWQCHSSPLYSYTETDPTVPSWAKQSSPTPISGGLYGLCKVQTSSCSLVYSPSTCSNGFCACPSGYTIVSIGLCSTSSGCYLYSCYRN